ncbi:hypothetical protein [Amorphus sp. 3PC139-8]|uniref:hypothetical protein n=1 Tax=Amorphus sp. 3PC139-8 TaxID=2735676 RepID=UPI00345CD186
MANALSIFRRTVIGLRDPSEAPTSLEIAVRFAHSVDSELVGIFVEDAELFEWSDSATIRHVSVRQAETAPRRHLADEFSEAAAVARGRLFAIESRLGIRVGFSIERAAAASLDLPGIEPSDLLVVLEPANPMARRSYPFSAIVNAVARTDLSVLFVPSNVAERSGPVMGIVGGRHTRAAELTGAVAHALATKSVLVLPQPDAPDAPPDVLGTGTERLIVLERGRFPHETSETFVTLASERRVPILLIGSAKK